MSHAAPEQELDEDGLVVQQYLSRVLVVLPPSAFGDQILRYARSSLYNVRVGTVSVTADADVPVQGRLQDEFLVDEPLAGQDMSSYSGILIAGSDGRSPLVDEQTAVELVRAAHREKKLIAAWGTAVEVLVRADVVRGRRVTGAIELQDQVSNAGGKYTGREVEASGHLVTARDEAAGMRFGQALADFVRI
jgi:putative intracellular protease/amidase